MLPPSFEPALRVDDVLAAHWLRQVTLRLRREVCWLWHEHGLLAGTEADTAAGGLLPPPGDALAAALDLTRWEAEKRRFHAGDATARYLSELIAVAAPDGHGAPPPPRGGFGWVVRELALTPFECFVLALALAPSVDAACGSVIAACLHQDGRALPTPALAQRLWESPEDALALLDAAQRLARYGLLAPPQDWDTPLRVPPLLARELLYPGGALPDALEAVTAVTEPLPDTATLALCAARLRSAGQQRRRLLPLCGASGAPLAGVAARIAAELGEGCVQPRAGAPENALAALMSLCWLRGLALVLPAPATDEHAEAAALPLPALPLTLFVLSADRRSAARLPQALPALELAPADWQARLAAWDAGLPLAGRDAELQAAMADCARRFRYERSHIDTLCATLRALGRPPRAADLYAACRADVDLGELARPVTPRFTLDELMLPPRQSAQISELVQAARALTRVHHDWGTARAWNECGLSALFAGPPGTGKTMAAEALARALAMPLYRIDLSQVVDKYIGETEKNLKRVFDAADAADVILFFDEADALFGKRTEVRDAHDRYANLEISYLLERMERFRGLAILASNRRKDLDEAFMRRLRFLIEFPQPGAEERLRIWRAVLPPAADASALDLEFLAQRFALAGGHIRSVVFQACLLSAGAGAPRRLEMPALVRALRRELDKLGRTVSLDQFGPYAAHLGD
ncbi:ATPase family protein associated with various cellular activities (AAA) [Plasticicumulans acidivorans]|uniref:ATPase family protein associated with various cellular activities (AAA) n=2 Tax=Plasticicumulans acidivorans TaxID=886464 RepID=A0A317MZM9_9GAMM|nr:ATPase family protein associated with various cellular activities (AAA) [Plasticicumulans acidivorans]